MTDNCGIDVERMEVQEILRTNSNASFPKSPIEVEMSFSSMMNGHETDLELMEVQEDFPNSPVEVVTNCSTTDLEVGGSIVISNTEEAAIDLRRASIAEEGSAQEETSTIKKFVVGKTGVLFKSIVFLICLIFVITQSKEFLTDYYKYPTKIETEVIVAKEVKLPAITLCFRSTMSYQKFCSYEPDLCEPPINIEESCRKQKYDLDCSRNKSNVKVPKQDRWTRDILQDYLFNDSYNDAELFWDYNYTSKVRTFVKDITYSGFFLKCYSQNLHLYQSGSKLETKKLKFDIEVGDLVSFFALNQVEIEPFFPKAKPKVFFAIHSPYLPIDPKELHAIMPGTEYDIDIQLEKEERLLPPPYQTNCRDNAPSKDAEEFANPNSYQMCLELCRSEYYKPMIGCDLAMTMIPTARDVCHRDLKFPVPDFEKRDEVKKKRLFCLQNCKQGCLKLHYKYKIKEDQLKYEYLRYRSRIMFFVKNPEVTVLRHVPLYGSGDVFSHIGGLLGCWLGVSVFTLTDILGKFFRKVVRWKRTFRKKEFTLKRFRKRRFTLRRFRKRKVQRAPHTSAIHQD